MLAQAPPDKALDEGWLTVRIDDDPEIARAVRVLTERGEVSGVYLFPVDDRDVWEVFRRDYKFVAAAGGVVVDERGWLLAIRRLGKWDLPKGKVEKEEGIEAAAVREVQEECGLRTLDLIAPVTETWHTYERKGRAHLKCTHWFLMRGSSTEEVTPQLDEDIEEVRWLDADGVRTMKADTYPSLLPVIAAWEGITRPKP